MDLVQRSFLKAYELHSSQFRKMSSVPYFVHVLDAAKYLMYETDDKEVISAGLLHDVLEDTSFSEEELLEGFGPRVFALVKFCTEKGNSVNTSVEDQRRTWKERKSRAVSKLIGASEEELLVFCADKVSNLLSIREDLVHGVDVWSKFNGSKEEVEWYYSEIHKALHPLKGRRLFSVYTDLMCVFSEKNKK